MAKKTYQVESPIRHDGNEYAVGDSIDLDNKEARDLLAVNAISDAGNTSNALSAPTDEAERLAVVVDAIGKLDAKDASLWMNNGAPKVPAIEAITGWQLTAKERDAAWTRINAAK